MSEEREDLERKALRRAVSSLFFVAYGATPRITHGEVARDPACGRPRHMIRLRAPATPTRGAVDGRFYGVTRCDCYRGLIEALCEQACGAPIDPADDDWITRGEE